MCLRTTRIISFLFLSILSGCTSSRIAPYISSTSPDEIIHFIPSDLKDRVGWAEDIIEGIEKTRRPVTPERVCAVVAVVEQESGFQIDPAVRNLPSVIRQGLKKKFARLGPMAGLAVKAILEAHAPGNKTSFEKRIARLKTESDLDRLFRDIEASVRHRFPGSLVMASLVSKLMGNGWIEDLNPVTTAGSMQVKVSYAKEMDEWKGLSDHEIRDQLYTRKGGVLAGASRLLAYEAKYQDILYRFADYNSGIYSSRNAAFQMALSDVGNRRLVADGDLLSYQPDGNPKDEITNSLKSMVEFGKHHEISDRSIRRAARHEKDEDFESSEIWEKVREVWSKKKGREAPYAQMPNLTLDSPKLSSKRSTDWFAHSVKRRYDECRRREKKADSQ